MVVVPVPRDADALGAALGQRLRRDRAAISSTGRCAVADPSRARACLPRDRAGYGAILTAISIAAGEALLRVDNGPAAKTSLRPSACSMSAASAKARSASTSSLCGAVARLGARGATVRRVVLRQRHESGRRRHQQEAAEARGLKLQKAEFEQLYKGPRNATRRRSSRQRRRLEAIGLDAAESQLIEVHQHLVEEICRWFGVPPHKVMHLLRATFSNIEHQAHRGRGRLDLAVGEALRG
jgi:hypothetical protein